MGRGNVCVTGQFEGLFYIDNDDWRVYRHDDGEDEPETILGRDLAYDDITDGGWIDDDWGSQEELGDIRECFIDSFTDRFPSFKKIEDEKWLDRTREVLLESRLFYICIEDNEWSLAVELIQKEDPYDDHLTGLQKQHYRRYLEGMKQSLLKRLPCIGTYAGAWTSGTIRREEVFDGTGQAKN